MDVIDSVALGFITSVITSAIEIIKAWIPKKNKDDNGLVFTRKKSKKKIHLPNQAVWPLLSLILGIIIFYAIQWDPLASVVGINRGGEVLTGAATGLGAQGFYRLKNVAGKKTGGTHETNAQNTGPLSTPQVEETCEDLNADDANVF
jgi:hypothetical protein